MNYGKLIPQLLQGSVTSLELFFLTLLFSLPLAMLVCKGKMSRIKPISIIVNIYIEIMRGTPLMLQLIFFYFAPFYVFKMSPLPRFWAAVFAFTINYSAYFAEIYRGGIQGFDKGQYEASKVLGFSKGYTFIHIVVPQVAKAIMPSIGNEVITLTKDTSLAMTIGVIELFQMAKTSSSSYFSVIPIFVAGVFYFIMNW
ncbi:MAG: amino acid ABC transporter permease, partial [Spirochaetales bacterium]|nr:amino acid ABC transporter permease [Candidatus Physcosoma equi]